MTEAEWLAATDSVTMLDYLRGKMSDRKLRLFTCAVCRQLAPFVETVSFIQGIELAESYADGKGTKAAMKRQRQTLDERNYSLAMGPNWASGECDALFLAIAALSERDFRTFPTYLSDQMAEGRSKSMMDVFRSTFVLVKDIFDNPFRPITINPSWLTSTVFALAPGIYSEKAFDRMPILADALQDAGCDNEDLLNHCRGPEPHVRGCFVIDALLDKQ